VDAGNEARPPLRARGYRADFRIFYGSPAAGRACLRKGRDRSSGLRRFAPPGPAEEHVSAPRYVSVIGASRATAELAAKAEELGELLAERGLIVVCGGREGVMEAVARGVKRAGGVSIGILPEADRLRAAPDLTYTVCSAMGYARNLSVVASGDVVIALGGAWGTLSEMPARNVGKR
jgi:uncharacterized protein (TIGR00725 family)